MEPEEKLDGQFIKLHFPVDNRRMEAPGMAHEFWCGETTCHDGRVEAVFHDPDQQVYTRAILSADEIEKALRDLTLGVELSLHSRVLPDELIRGHDR